MTKNQRTAFVETLKHVSDIAVLSLMTDTMLEALRRNLLTSADCDYILTAIRHGVARAENSHYAIQPLVQILEGGSHE